VRPLLAALMLLASASLAGDPPRKPLHSCITACGLRADLDEGKCEALNVAEARILRLYSLKVPEFKPGFAACMALDGWTVKVHKRTKLDEACSIDSWLEARFWTHPLCVYGYTHRDQHVIELADDAFTFNALAHELGHVLDHAFGTAQGDHCGWERRGLKDAILKATGEPDLTIENCD
jgi:hypothetical protein